MCWKAREGFSRGMTWSDCDKHTGEGKTFSFRNPHLCMGYEPYPLTDLHPMATSPIFIAVCFLQWFQVLLFYEVSQQVCLLFPSLSSSAALLFSSPRTCHPIQHCLQSVSDLGQSTWSGQGVRCSHLCTSVYVSLCLQSPVPLCQGSVWEVGGVH